MNEFLQFLSSNTVLALIVSIIIFVVTLVLVVKRLIGFFITLLLLFFTIVSGYAILNHDIVRAFLLKYYVEKDQKETTKENPSNFQQKLLDTYESLKKELEEQKEKIQEAIKQSQVEKEKREDKDNHH